jgi:L-ascorbate metabolism protein UlaG (beta-lactamase superfamily)
MRIKHLGHACLLVETAQTRLLVDPGTYSSGYQGLTDLDAVILTHQHPDHVDVESIPDLLRGNQGAALLAEPETAEKLRDVTAHAFAAGDSDAFGDLTVTALGGQHARIHDLIAPLGNIGVLIREGGGPTLFHPGDSYADAPPGVDVLAFPLNAPWTRISETLDFLRRLAAPVLVPIHDGLLNDTGRSAYLMHVSNFGPAESELHDLSDGSAYSA